MCAIAGMVNLSCDKQILDKMLASMSRRGPDETGIFQGRDCALLHSRLAIIDLAGGKQPMTLQCVGERYTLVYNGELYNTHEVRQELRTLGHSFSGHSDTEVVLHAYAQWGKTCLQKLNGIFAFAVWEQTRKRLFLARDRMGVKPLFYKLHEGGLLFASEIKTLLRYPTVRAQLDGEGVAQLLLLGPGRIPGSGVLRGILELEPGCCGWYENGAWQWQRYWHLTDREHTDDFETTVETVRYLVTDSIRRQMVSDVPIGTFLSGGLDSSLITAVCSRETVSQGEILTTFSLDYEDNERYFTPGKFQPNSDNAFIQLMQDHLHTDHHWTVLSPENLVSALEEATVARDLPGMADVDFSLLVFCRQIRDHVKVALSGECADEIFGGYPWYRDPEIRAQEGFPWAQNTRQRAAFLAPEIHDRIDPEEFVMDFYRQTIDQCDILPGTDALQRRMKEMVNLNHRWFMQTLLDRKDRMSMYSGLEVRVPFCDYRIAEYLYGVPWEFKDYQGREKGLLRYACGDLLPEAVRNRKKSPYPKTFHPRYTALVTERLQQLLCQKEAPIFQLVSRSALEDLIHAQFPWPWYGQLMRTPQTIAYMLQLDFWLRHYRVEIL